MKRFILLAVALTLIMAACAQQGPTTLRVMTHDSFQVSESVIAAFEQANNVNVEILKSGDAGAALNKAILTIDAPLADIFYGVDNSFLTRALEAGIYENYASPLLAQIPTEFILDPEYYALPVDYGAVCINYDKEFFANHHLAPPQTLEDLIKPEYKNMLVVDDPALSSPGMAFLLATIAHFGEDNYLPYWRALSNNGLAVADSWETSYFNYFTALSEGAGVYPMVISYAASPAAEVIYSDPPLTEAPTASIMGPDACYRQIEFVGILKGTKNLAIAQKFIDFMLSVPFQEDMPLQMFVYPVNMDAVLPDAFVQYAQVAPQVANLDPALIAANRDQWLEDWRTAVFH